ncbi:hypothetical protein G7D34_003692 [Salmonella enterica]|nr:hypothetical protein [Salmonella enterica]
MIFPSEEIKTNEDFKIACQQSGREAIRILQWLQHVAKEEAFADTASADLRTENFHKNKHINSVIRDIENATTPFAPNFGKPKQKDTK